MISNMVNTSCHSSRPLVSVSVIYLATIAVIGLQLDSKSAALLMLPATTKQPVLGFGWQSLEVGDQTSQAAEKRHKGQATVDILTSAGLHAAHDDSLQGACWADTRTGDPPQRAPSPDPKS